MWGAVSLQCYRRLKNDEKTRFDGKSFRKRKTNGDVRRCCKKLDHHLKPSLLCFLKNIILYNWKVVKPFSYTSFKTSTGVDTKLLGYGPAGSAVLCKLNVAK